MWYVCRDYLAKNQCIDSADFYTPQEKLHAECGLRPTEIVMSGSLGHGTALPWKFDADIVIYSEGVLHVCLMYELASCMCMHV